MTDIYKEMKESEEIYINNDQYGLWQKKYLGTNRGLEKALEAVHNMGNTKSLFEVMLERNFLPPNRPDSREN
jgi:hypothetical protein